MRGRYVQLGVVLALLLAGSAAYVVIGQSLYARYAVAYASERGACGSLITWNPPSRIYTAFYANQSSLVSVSYRSATPQPLRIALRIPGLTQTETITTEAEPAPQQATLKPPLLGPAALDALVGPGQRAGELDLTVAPSGAAVCQVSAPVTLLSRQWMYWSDSVSGDNARYLAGWVTPQDPVISDLIGRASLYLAAHPAQYPATTSLHGYAGGQASAADVREQVNALFDTLQFVYHLHYAQDNVPFAQDAQQRIQLPKDILSTSAPTGMCLETTAILASAIERLGMRPYFIIVPGHAFLGVALGPGPAAPLAFWETSDLNGGVDGHQANLHGDAEYNSDEVRGQIVRVVDVQLERQLGIEPIE